MRAGGGPRGPRRALDAAHRPRRLLRRPALQRLRRAPGHPARRARRSPARPGRARRDGASRGPGATGAPPVRAHAGAAGGAACGDLVRISLAVRGDVVVDAGADAAGCGAAQAAASAAVALVRGAPVLEAARVSADAIADELGGLLPGKRHAAELAEDALHCALGAAVRADADAEID